MSSPKQSQKGKGKEPATLDQPNPDPFKIDIYHDLVNAKRFVRKSQYRPIIRKVIQRYDEIRQSPNIHDESLKELYKYLTERDWVSQLTETQSQTKLYKQLTGNSRQCPCLHFAGWIIASVAWKTMKDTVPAMLSFWWKEEFPGTSAFFPTIQLDPEMQRQKVLGNTPKDFKAKFSMFKSSEQHTTSNAKSSGSKSTQEGDEDHASEASTDWEESEEEDVSHPLQNASSSQKTKTPVPKQYQWPPKVFLPMNYQMQMSDEEDSDGQSTAEESSSQKTTPMAVDAGKAATSSKADSSAAISETAATSSQTIAGPSTTATSSKADSPAATSETAATSSQTIAGPSNMTAYSKTDSPIISPIIGQDNTATSSKPGSPLLLTRGNTFTSPAKPSMFSAPDTAIFKQGPPFPSVGETLPRSETPGPSVKVTPIFKTSRSHNGDSLLKTAINRNAEQLPRPSQLNPSGSETFVFGGSPIHADKLTASSPQEDCPSDAECYEAEKAAENALQSYKKPQSFPSPEPDTQKRRSSVDIGSTNQKRQKLAGNGDCDGSLDGPPAISPSGGTRKPNRRIPTAFINNEPGATRTLDEWKMWVSVSIKGIAGRLCHVESRQVDAAVDDHRLTRLEDAVSRSDGDGSLKQSSSNGAVNLDWIQARMDDRHNHTDQVVHNCATDILNLGGELIRSQGDVISSIEKHFGAEGGGSKASNKNPEDGIQFSEEVNKILNDKAGKLDLVVCPIEQILDDIRQKRQAEDAELRTQNETLRTQNESLRAENEELRKQNEASRKQGDKILEEISKISQNRQETEKFQASMKTRTQLILNAITKIMGEPEVLPSAQAETAT